MRELRFYSAIARAGRLNYRLKIMLIAFLGTHVPLLAIIAFYLLRSSADMGLVWSTLGVALVATLLGTGITLFVLNQMLQPVLLTSRALRRFRTERVIETLPTEFGDEAGTLMADAADTLRQLEATLTLLETTDSVTGLCNRDGLAGRAGPTLERGRAAMVAVQVANFQRLATTYDQKSADYLARVVAARLREAAAPGDIVARIDGGAFVVLRSESEEAGENMGADMGADMGAAAERFAETLSIAVGASVSLAGVEMTPDCRVGIALAPADGETVEALVDAALAAAAAGGELRNITFHSSDMRKQAQARFMLEQEMRTALKHDQFRLHFQPVVDVAARRPVSAEALIRWQHPDRGMISPGLFIPVAERSGLIDDIGVWVMRSALSQIGAWRRDGVGLDKVAINLSARQFLDPRLTGLLREAMSDARVDAGQLEIELTESAAMVDFDHTRRMFGQLTDMGVSIAIDDFGTGYASMSYLRKLPFNKLKIDREFVTNVDSSPQGQAICDAMVALGKGLGLEVLAEGAERAEEVAYLEGRGCELFQGFYFARPVAPEDMAETLADIRMGLAELPPAAPATQHVA